MQLHYCNRTNNPINYFIETQPDISITINRIHVCNLSQLGLGLIHKPVSQVPMPGPVSDGRQREKKKKTKLASKVLFFC